ncbi:MAG TPA: (2Fe-2S)-binding protein [Jatrophihabitans sp.]|jgi:hypothetical protein
MTDAPSKTIAELASFGPFFVVESHPVAAAPSGAWRPLAELVDDPDALPGRVLSVRAALATAAGREPDAIELRVAASVTQLGLVARVLSPALAVAVISGQILDVELTRLWWQPELGGGFPLSVPDAFRPYGEREISIERDIANVVRRLGDVVLERMAASLVTAVSSAFSVSEQVLWGNVASAINGAATMICRQRPSLTAQTGVIAAGLLGRAPFNLRNPVLGTSFRRNSCCLIYRVAPRADGRTTPGALCGDCVLTGR